MNYGALKSQFALLLNRRDCSSAQIDIFMQQGVERIQREIRFPGISKTVAYIVDGNYAGGLGIPDDYLALEALTFQSSCGAWQLERRSLNEVLREARLVASPRLYARRGAKFVLGPTPALGDQIDIDYYSDLPLLSHDYDENIITVSCPTLPIYAALSLAGDYFRDKRRDDWEARYVQVKDELQTQADSDELSSAAVSSAYAWPCDDY